jgi:hypothetical protein
MKTIDQTPETQAVIESLTTGRPIDPEMRERIRVKARLIRGRIVREHGLVNIAVPAIGEFRDEARS